MVVKQGEKYKGSQELYLADGVKTANVLLKTGDQFNSLYRHKLSFPELPANCGEACLTVMRGIHGLEKDPVERVVPGNKGSIVCNDPMVTRESILKNKEEFSLNEKARPKLGEAYAVGVDAKEYESEKSKLEEGKTPYLFNFHWATVVAVSGTDVVTVENAGSSTKTGWWFQMYSQEKEKQSFHSHYEQHKLIGSKGVTMEIKMRKSEQKNVVIDLIDDDESRDV